MKSLVFSIGFILIASIAYAQPGAPDFTPSPFGFVELLVGAGAIYGGKKSLDSHRKKNKE